MIYPIYLFFLIPGASLLAYIGLRIDRFLHIEFPIHPPYNFIIFAICLVVGFILLWYTYSFLILEGEGGPIPPFSHKTKRLVKVGPYKYVRHPSIVAKLIGVIGLGFAFRSVTFLLVIVPLLLAGSIINNRKFQEKPMEQAFGDEYLEYKKETPMLFPRFFYRNRGARIHGR